MPNQDTGGFTDNNLRSQSCLFWSVCGRLQLGGISPAQLVLSICGDCRWIWFSICEVGFCCGLLNIVWPDLVNVRPVFSLFGIVCYLYQWSSFYNLQNYYLCLGAIISFNFSFDANFVSDVADIITNIDISINIADRG